VTLNGSFTDPNVGDTHTFLWHLESSTNGQAVPDATTQSLSFTPIDDGVYTFSFTVTDSHGAQGSDTVVVTAENVPPVVSIDSITDETGAEIGVDVPVALVGLEVDLAGSFTDVGTLDTHTADITWGDGTTDPGFDAFSDCVGGVTGTLNATHIYADPGMYTITLNVTDDDAGVGTTTAQIEVVDAAGAVAEVVESLTPLADDPNIQAAIDKLQGEQDGGASNGALDKLEQGNPNAALEKIKQALGYLEAAEAADPSLDLTYDKGLLGLAAKSVAVNAIAEAEAVAFKPNDLLKIQQAKDLVAQGDALLAAHDYVGAVDKDQQAVRKVQNIR
jgi:PKD repeat protein